MTKNCSWMAIVVLLAACTTQEVAEPREDATVIDLGEVEAEKQENRPPVAGDDSAETFAGQQVVIEVMENDGDPDDDGLTITEVTQGDHGFVEISGRDIEYTPIDAMFVGVDTFSYTIDDGNGETDDANVAVNVKVAPTLIILTPADDETFPFGTDPNVTFAVTGCTFTAPTSDPQGCHAHRWIDGAPFPGGLGIYSVSAFDVTGLMPGEHTFRLALARNDGTDSLWSPAIEDTVTFTVESPPDGGAGD